MFRRLEIPTPFQIGPVNAYLAGRTLVDPGPDSDEAWADLLTALEHRDLAPEDIEQVLITHPHPDHFGLAHRFRERGARVLASPDAARVVDDFPGWLEYEAGFFVDFFERCGLARDAAETVTELPQAFLPYAPSVAVDRELTAGDEVAVQNATLTVDAVEGHATGELIFAHRVDGERRALVGDNVLPEITPNPFLQPPAEPGGERPRVLPAYNASLERLAEQPFDRFLPGHREIIAAPTGRIEEIRAAHEKRTEEVASIVDGPTTPVEVMDELFGDLPATEQFSGLSEAVGHLDVLETRGELERREEGGLFVYA